MPIIDYSHRTVLKGSPFTCLCDQLQYGLKVTTFISAKKILEKLDYEYQKNPSQEKTKL